MSAKRNSFQDPSPSLYYGSAIVIALIFALMSAYVVFQIRATDYASGGSAALNTTRLVADDFEDKFNDIDTLLRSIGRQYVEGLENGPEDRARLAERMTREIADHPIVARLFVADPAGQPVLVSGSFKSESNSASVLDQKYFITAAAGDQSLIFEGPIQAKFEHVIILARRLEDREGVYLGVVVASLPVDAFAKMLSTLELVDHGVIVLRTNDGVQIARYSTEPSERGTPGDSNISPTLKALLRQHADRTLYEAVSPLDHVQRLYAFQKFRHAPFFALVGVPTQYLDRSWQRLAIELGLLCVGVTIAALWIAYRLHISAVLLCEDKRLLEKRVVIRTEELETKNRALIASERKFSEAMANAPIGMALFTPEGHIAEVNSALCDILGYTREELFALDLGPLATPQDPLIDLEVMRRLACDDQNTCRVERRYLHKDGREISTQVDVSVARGGSGNVRYFVCQIQDVSARVAYEDRLRALLDTAVDGVYIHDFDGAIVEFSQSFADMLGYSRDEIRRMNVADIDAIKSADELRASFREEAQSGKALVIETRHRRKDGSVFDVEISVKAIELSGQTYLYTSSRDISARVHMQKLLEEERRRLRDFSNSTADWFWEVDEKLKFSYLSESFTSFNGLSAEDLLGMSLPAIYARDALNAEEIKAKGLERFDARKPLRDVEVAYKDDQGEVQWFSASGVPIFDDTGRFAGYRGVAAIVTARKRAELALERNRRLLQEMVDSSPYGIGVFDDNQDCIVRNANYGRILGLPQGLLDRKPFRLSDQFRFCFDRGDFVDLGVDLEAEQAWKIVQAPGIRQAERQLGNGRWVETRVAPVTGGALVTYFDVTNYKTIENELRQTKERLEAAAAAGIVGLWDCDFVNGKFFWDSVMYQLYGLRENDFESPRDAFFACMHPDDKELVKGVFQQAFNGRSNPELEFRIIRPDGAVRCLRGQSRTYFGSDRKLSRMVGVVYDVTEQKETLQALQQAKSQAEAANRAKSDFLAIISHEIRTPLNAILGMTQVLARSGLDADQAGCVRSLDASGQNMLALLTEILDLSKIEAGRLELDEIPFTLAEVVRCVVDTFAAPAKNKGLTLCVEPLPDLPALLGDSVRLGQVLTNLLGNAVKFTAQGGITISIEALDRSPESIRLFFAVRDTGIGIAPEHLGRLFEPFVQAESATYRKFGGTGLGLAITKRLVGLMNGSIGVESKPGKGSEFWFTLSLDVASPTVKTKTHPAAGDTDKRLSGARLLVVDDTETNREIAIKLLTLEGAVCEGAENGWTAIERLRANPDDFDLVLMDVQMPDIDGLETTRIIRHDLGLADMPVIALTAGAMASQRELAREAGMNGFVAKPFRLRELVAALSPWLPCRAIVEASSAPYVGESDRPAA